MNMNSFVSAEDRKIMREHVNKIFANGSCETKFQLDTAKIYIRLLDTIEYFENANFALSKTNVDLDFKVMDAEDTEKALRERIRDLEMGINAANERWLEAREQSGIRDSQVKEILDTLNRLQARITKKKIKPIKTPISKKVKR